MKPATQCTCHFDPARGETLDLMSFLGSLHVLRQAHHHFLSSVCDSLQPKTSSLHQSLYILVNLLSHKKKKNLKMSSPPPFSATA